MRGVVGRQIDREPGLGGRSDQKPVLPCESVVAEDGLVGEGDDVLAGIGGDELFEERTVDLWAVSWQVAGLGVTPQTARAERRCAMIAISMPSAPAPGPATDGQCRSSQWWIGVTGIT